MDFVYRPEGTRERRWAWEPGRMKLSEAELAEEMWENLTAGREKQVTHGEWASAVTAGSMRAVHVLLWVLMRRDVPDLDFADVDFYPDEVGFDVGDDAVRELLGVLEELEDPTELQLAQIAAFRERLGLPPVEPSSEQADPEPDDAAAEVPTTAPAGPAELVDQPAG